MLVLQAFALQMCICISDSMQAKCIVAPLLLYIKAFKSDGITRGVELPHKLSEEFLAVGHRNSCVQGVINLNFPFNTAQNIAYCNPVITSDMKNLDKFPGGSTKVTVRHRLKYCTAL